MNNSNGAEKNKVWTTDDLRNSSSNWTLAGDKALLEILQNIHKDLVQRTENTTEKLHSLDSELSKTSLSLKNVNNRFMGLNSTQFVESTVQEEDLEVIRETDTISNSLIINSASTPKKDKEDDEIEKREKTLQSVSKSVSVLEGLCERLDISPDSDSDSDSLPEDASQRTVLRPKDVYSENALPHIIGSRKWQRKWHIGLQECSSDSDSEEDGKSKDRGNKVADEEYSTSEGESVTAPGEPNRVAERKSQMSLPIPRITHSDPARSSMTSTSTNNSTDTTDSEVAKINADLKASSEDVGSGAHRGNYAEGDRKVAPQMRAKPSDFAAELARKLGSNITTNPINANVKYEGNAQGNTDARQDGGRAASKQGKSSKKASYDPGFSNKPDKRITGNIFLDEPPPMDSESYTEDKGDDLFGSNDEVDDMSDSLFTNKPSKSNQVKSGQFQSGGLFGNRNTSNYGGLFDDLPDDEEDVDFQTKPSEKTKIITKNIKVEDRPRVKSKGLFDDFEDEEFLVKKPVKKDSTKTDKANDGLFGSSTAKSVTTTRSKGLFDDDFDDFDTSLNIKKDFKPKPVTSAVKKPSKGLFDDDESEDEEGLFGVGSSKVSQISKSSSLVKNIEVKSTLVPDKDTLKTKNTSATVTKKSSLFDDMESDDDDLFASLKKSSVPQNKPIYKENVKKSDIFEETKPLGNAESTNKSQKGLFEDDAKSEGEDLFASLRLPQKKTLNVNKDIIEVKKETQVDQSTAKVEDMKEAAEPKKPAGAVSMFGNNSAILKGPNSLAASVLVKKRRESSSDSEDDLFKSVSNKEVVAEDKRKEVKKKEIIVKIAAKKPEAEKTPSKEEAAIGKAEIQKVDKPIKDKNVTENLGKSSKDKVVSFYDSSTDYEDDLFQDKSKKTVDVKTKPANRLFDKDATIEGETDVVSKEKKTSKDNSKLFSDSSTDGDEDLFGKKIKNASRLFDDVPPPLEVPPPLDEDTTVSKVPKDVNSLFDYDDDEDLFSTIRNITKTSKTKDSARPESSGLFDDLPKEVERESAKPTSIGLFCDEPPDLDENAGENSGTFNNEDNESFREKQAMKSSGGSDMFADYPYYKTRNIIKNDKRTESNVEDVTSGINSSKSNKDIDRVSRSNTTNAEDKDGFTTNIDTIGKKVSIFSDDSDDDDLFSSLSKAKVSKDVKKSDERTSPNANGNSSSNGSKRPSIVDMLKEAEVPNKVCFDKAEIIPENVDTVTPKLEVTVPKPTIASVKPDIASKPQIKGFKPDILSSKVESNTNDDGIIKSDDKKSCKPEIAKPSIKTKPEIINPKPSVVVNTDSSNTKPDLSDSMSISKPEMLTPKPELPSSKPEVPASKPEILVSKSSLLPSKPELPTSKPEVPTSKPELPISKPRDLPSKPELPTSKPQLPVSKSELQTSKPEVDVSKSELPTSKRQVLPSKPELPTSKPELPVSKPDLQTSKPEAGVSKPELPSSKPQVLPSKPELPISKPDLQTSKSEVDVLKSELPTSKRQVVPLKPELPVSKPELPTSKPFVLPSKTELPDSKPELTVSKPELQTSKPEVDVLNPESPTTKPEVPASKPKMPIKQDSKEKSYSTSSDHGDINTDDSESSKSMTSPKPSVGFEDNYAEDENSRHKYVAVKPEVVSSKPTVKLEGEDAKKENVNKPDTKVQQKDEEVTNLSKNLECENMEKNERKVDSIQKEISKIDGIKASLSKRIMEEKSKSTLDVSEETDGGSHSSLKSKQSKSENASPTKTIGKLQTNLNINVKALIPGSAPKLVKDINEERKGSEPLNVPNKNLESVKSVSFDDEPKSLDSVLSNSWSKDKIKVQVKRRPPSRKARQEAARKSAADILFSFDETDNSNDFVSSLPTSPLTESQSITGSSKDNELLSSLDSSHSDDLFSNKIQTIGSVYKDTEEETIPKAETSSKQDYESLPDIDKFSVSVNPIKKDRSIGIKADDLFDLLTKEATEKAEDGIFVSKKVEIQTSKKSETKLETGLSKKPLGLFGEMDEDLDLFSGSKSKKTTLLFGDDDEELFTASKPKGNVLIKPKEEIKIESNQGAIKKKKVKSVFGDSDSDSDLFSSKVKSNEHKSSKNTKKTGETVSKTKSEDSKSKKTSLFGGSDTEDDLFFKPSKGIGGGFGKKSSGKTIFNDEYDENVDIFKTNKAPSVKSSSSIKLGHTNRTTLLTSAEVATQDPLSSFFQDD